ncbi:MAG TPA: TAXI family TRAP transporter solute-binding subunit [Candidatus Methylomirabilis sp.]|nr:TAXI family TRAP transporter solute-binding subunit [Candidatus Methylomirabilis sp.]
MLTPGSREARRREIAWIAAVILTGVLIVVSIALMGGTPPKKIVMATGQPGGMYDTFGREYARRLGAQGLKVELVNTAGSVDNFRRIVDGKVDVAFAQSGTYQLIADPDHKVTGLAAIYFEPLWVFLKSRLVLDETSVFRERSVAVGPLGSGTEAVAKAMLAEQGYNITTPAIVNLTFAQAREQLTAGRLDVAFFVTSYRDPDVTALLRRKDLQLMTFRREAAYTRRLPGLTAIRVSEGLLDLRDNIPPESVTLLSPSAMLIGRADLNPRVVELVLKVAQAVHRPGSLIDPPLRFPTSEGVDVPLNDAAETYLTSGESFLSRNLPYRALRWVLLLKLLVLPLLAVWVPALKIAPMIVEWRNNRWLRRYYARLRDAETTVATAHEPDELRAAISALEALRMEVQARARTLPVQRQRDVYHWRLHVSLILNEAIERLGHMEAKIAR